MKSAAKRPAKPTIRVPRELPSFEEVELQWAREEYRRRNPDIQSHALDNFNLAFKVNQVKKPKMVAPIKVKPIRVYTTKKDLNYE
ncbi:hypothetical protein SEA_NICEHOUSE_202 [Rhodococcus phage NiceHouse]|nr:hypothetical protein SEA_NICEHOUSE_202 [Rhodococcus phage NiceHouse]